MGGKFFDFVEWQTEGRPMRYRVENRTKIAMVTIGIIAWHDPLQCYGFVPRGEFGDVLIGADGLMEIAQFIDNLMLERKLEKQNNG